MRGIWKWLAGQLTCRHSQAVAEADQMRAKATTTNRFIRRCFMRPNANARSKRHVGAHSVITANMKRR